MSAQQQHFQFAFVSADNVSYLSTPITFYPSQVALDCMKPNSFGIFSIDYLNKCPTRPIMGTSHELPNIVLDTTTEPLDSTSILNNDSTPTIETDSDTDTITPAFFSKSPEPSQCAPEPSRVYKSDKTTLRTPDMWYQTAFISDLEMAYKMTRGINNFDERVKVWSKMTLKAEMLALEKGLIKTFSRSRKHWVTLCLLLIDSNKGIKNGFTKKEFRSLKYSSKAKVGDFTKFISGKSWRHWCSGRHLKPYGDRYELLW